MSCIRFLTTLFVGAAKLEVTAEDKAGYALSLVSSVDQMCIVFKGTLADEEKEDLFEVNADDVVQCHFSSETSHLGDMSISMADIDTSDDWVLVRPQDGTVSGYVLTVKVKLMERAPSDWFSIGITALNHLPWYFKAEDLYALTKHILKEYNISTSRPVTELCSLIDNASVVLATNVLSVRVEEGFSVIHELDDLLEKVFAASDQKVDSGLVQLARSLQRLRRTVTRRVESLSEGTRQQMTALQGRVAEAGDRAQGRCRSTVHTAYFWAVERTEQTSQWVRSEREGLVSALNGLTVRGQAVVSDTTARLAQAPREVAERVRGDVHSRIAEVTQRVQELPQKVHPYVVGVVEASQPYLASAMHTAGPYVQSLRERAGPVEEWLQETKGAVEKKYPAVASASEQAAQLLGEVGRYCTDGQYFEQNHTPAQPQAQPEHPLEESSDRVELQTEEVQTEDATQMSEEEAALVASLSPQSDFMTHVESPVATF